jgi:hypothetical protein
MMRANAGWKIVGLTVATVVALQEQTRADPQGTDAPTELDGTVNDIDPREAKPATHATRRNLSPPPPFDAPNPSEQKAARSLRSRGEKQSIAGWIHLGLGTVLLVAGVWILDKDGSELFGYGGGGGFMAFGISGILVGVPLLLVGEVNKREASWMTVGLSPLVHGAQWAGGTTQVSWRF